MTLSAKVAVVDQDYGLRILQYLPGRMRIAVRGLLHNPALARQLEYQLSDLFCSQVIRADCRSGRLLVCWSPEQQAKGFSAAETILKAVAVAQRLPLKAVATESAARSDSFAATDLTRGLTDEQVRYRQTEFGPNILPEQAFPSLWKIAVGQCKDVMTIAFCSVAGLSFALGRFYDGVTMLSVVVLNAVVATLQEGRLQHEAKGLKQLSAHKAIAIRGGHELNLPASGVVPGDILQIVAGDRIAADGRLVLSSYLEVDESCLTGESVAVSKRPPDTVYLGTLVTRGKARMQVTAIGAHTEMGSLARSLSQEELVLSPLQLRLRIIGRWLVTGIIVTVGAVVIVGLMRGIEARAMWLTGLTLAASAIPEGLPLLITVGLTAGVRRVGKRKAIVRRLSALETLGRATVICSDKTGTLTLNQMTVRQVYCGDTLWSVRGDGYCPEGDIYSLDETVTSQSDVRELTRHAVLCCDASIVRSQPPEGSAKPVYTATGDPTEAALLALAAKSGWQPNHIRSEFVRTHETPFTSERRTMSVVCVSAQTSGAATLVMKGALEEVLTRATQWYKNGHIVALTELDRQRFMRYAKAMSQLSLRVLCIAYRPLLDTIIEPHSAADCPAVPMNWESELIVAGIVGMIDPPRPEVRESLRQCAEGGIRVVMITGDHPDTAIAVAHDIGLLKASDCGRQRVLTGDEIDRLDSTELSSLVDRIVLYARVSPHHKLAIVRALQAQGHIVAMTGDGINDAPAIRKADIGIAMGRSGTAVAKEASAVTITDDNFNTILDAVREGRGVLGNVRRSVGYLLSGNIGEVLFTALAVLGGLPLPLLPVQILLVNLLTDAAPTLALLTQARPQSTQELAPVRDLTDRSFALQILWRGAVIGSSTLGVFMLGLRLFASPAVARTMAMVSLVGAELLQIGIWHADPDERRSEGNPHPHLWLPANRTLQLTAGVTGVGLLSAVYVPPLRSLAQTSRLSFTALTIALAGASVLPVVCWLENRWAGDTTGKERRDQACELPRGGALPLDLAPRYSLVVRPINA